LKTVTGYHTLLPPFCCIFGLTGTGYGTKYGRQMV
jgi:hypothetical protein